MLNKLTYNSKQKKEALQELQNRIANLLKDKNLYSFKLMDGYGQLPERKNLEQTSKQKMLMQLMSILGTREQGT